MRDDKEKLEKILECIDRIQEYTCDGEDRFFSEHLIQDAVIRNLQVIGEAVKELSEGLKLRYGDVEWHKASRMRDKVTHDYFEVDYKIVWDTIQKSLPPFRERIEDIHQRLVYKVTDDKIGPSSLEQKLKDKDSLD